MIIYKQKIKKYNKKELKKFKKREKYLKTNR